MSTFMLYKINDVHIHVYTMYMYIHVHKMYNTCVCTMYIQVRL